MNEGMPKPASKKNRRTVDGDYTGKINGENEGALCKKRTVSGGKHYAAKFSSSSPPIPLPKTAKTNSDALLLPLQPVPKKNLPKKTAHDAGKRPHLDENNTTDRPKYNDRQDTNRVVDTYATVYSFSCSIIDMRFIGNGGGGSGSNVEIDRVTDFFRSNRTALEFARAVYRALTTNTAMRLSEIERCIGIGIGMKTDKSRVLFEELFCKNKHRCRFGAGCANCMLHAQWVYEFVYGSREPKFLCAYWDDEQACFEDVNEIAAWIKRDNEEEQKNIDSDTDEAVTATGCSFIVVSKSPLRPRDLEKESRDWTACDDDNPHGFSVRMFSRCNLHCCK